MTKITDKKFDITESPKVMWLSPQCENDGDGRTWCEDRLDDCDECGSPAVKYIRADLVKKLFEKL